MSEKEDKEGHHTQQLTRQRAGKHNRTERQPQPHRLAPPTATTGPSPVPSPVGRGVITEIPLTSCCSLLTVLVGLM